jgi:plasmid stabilization system protein ParE
MAGIYDWIATDSKIAADAWLDGIATEIESLAVVPRRCPRAPECETFAAEVRHKIHGDYRVLFSIDGRRVIVVGVRHASRLPLHPEP